MRVGVIGAGRIGGLVAAKLAQAGHSVAIANSRGPETLAQAADEIGATASDLAHVGQGAEIIVLSVPYSAISVIDPTFLRSAAFVVDTGNYVPVFRDPPVAGIDAGSVESVWTQAMLRRPLVKVLNTINVPSLRDLGRPAGAPDRIALSVASDSDEGRELGYELLEELGYDAVDGGSLHQSWRQQPGTPAFCSNLNAAGVAAALDAARAAQTTEWRAMMAARAG